MPNNLTRVEAQERARLISVCSYDVCLDLTAADAFSSTTRITFTARQAANTFVELTGIATSVTLNGQILGGAHDGDRIWCPVDAGENVLEVVATCDYSSNGEGMHRFIDPLDSKPYLYTQFEAYEAHRVFACFDQPDLKAPWTLTVQAPRDWVVVSNTTPMVADGMWHFPSSAPISTYLYAVVAGPFAHVAAEHEGIPLGLYCRESLKQYLDVDELLSLTRQGFDFYQPLFATPYPFGKYDQLFVPEFNARGMENVACVTLSDDLLFQATVTRGDRLMRAMVIQHELAHMWFGNLVTMRWWDDLWLNEAFATYVSIHALVEATEYKEGWTFFCDQATARAISQDQLASTHPVCAVAPDIHTAQQNFDGITYAKGASLLKQLVAWVGPEAFFEGLQGYFREFAWGNTDLTDLLSQLEKRSARDLSSWRDEWLLTTGVNTLRPIFVAQHGVYSEFTVEQTGELLRSHRVAVGLYNQVDGEFVRVGRHELDVAGSSTKAARLVGVPVADLVLVNDDDLAYCKTRLDSASWTTLLTSISSLRDPLAQTLCWAAAWDMTRDAEVPTREFLALVFAALPTVTDMGVLQRLLTQLRTAIRCYGDPALAESRLSKMCDVAIELVLSSSGDAQLLFLQAAVDTAMSANQIEFLTGMLAGVESLSGLSGLSGDSEVRWAVIKRLATLNVLDVKAIAAELERDPSLHGQQHAAAARAALPSEKDATWRALVTDQSLSGHELLALMTGFNQPDQDLKSFVGPYFEALSTVWAAQALNSTSVLRQIRTMFPMHVSATVHAQTVAALDSELPEPVRRVLLECLDDLSRALKCQAADR